MGRPLNKRYFGATQTPEGGADLTGEGRLTASVKIGARAATELGIILSQRSETKFKVQDDPDGSGLAATIGICNLVNKATGDLADDEMSLQGFVADGNSSNAVYIRKVQNRTMVDFDNNHYTWEVQDDSTANILVLTAI
jgi:hypothetical protein